MTVDTGIDMVEVGGGGGVGWLHLYSYSEHAHLLPSVKKGGNTDVSIMLPIGAGLVFPYKQNIM